MGSVVRLSVFDLMSGLPIDVGVEVGASATRHGVAVERARAKGHKVEWFSTDVWPGSVEIDGWGVEGWVTDEVGALAFILAEWGVTNLKGKWWAEVVATLPKWREAERETRYRLRFVLAVC